MTDNIDFDFFDDPIDQDRRKEALPNYPRHSIDENDEKSSSSDLGLRETQYNSGDKKSSFSSNKQRVSHTSKNSSGSSKSKPRHQKYSDSSSTDEEPDTVHIRVNVHGKSRDVKDGSTRHSRDIGNKHIKNKPPLPEEPINRPRTTKSRQFKIEETSNVSYSSSDEEELQRVHVKSQRRADPQMRLGLGDLLSPRSSASSNRSQRNSSEWSTGSEESDEGRRRPHSRLNKRQSSGSEKESFRRLSRDRHSKASENRHRQSRSSDSSITVSSLSDMEMPDRKSQSITSPSKVKTQKAADSDRMSLEILLSALLEADQNESGQRKNVRINAPEERGQGASRTKANYSFTSDKSRLIDKENQRLLNSILAQRPRVSQPKTGADNPAPSMQAGAKPKSRRRRVSPPRRVTNSTVNRNREQQRIERENLALLHRLNQIKPSAEISRNKCLGDYDRQMSYHCPDMRLEYDRSSLSNGARKQRPSSANYNRPSSAYGSTSRSSRPTSATTRPVSAVARPISATTRPVSATTRPVNATTRPVSATTRRAGIMSINKRPEWQSGW